MQAVGEHNFASWSLKGKVNGFQRVQNNLLVLDTFLADLQAMRQVTFHLFPVLYIAHTSII